MTRPKWLRLAILWPVPVIIVTALLFGHRLQGPQLPGYRLASQPMVQTVVATGRVISTSRAQVGSEITGTVRVRRVREGDAVRPGDVLVELRADDLGARVREAEAALQQLQFTTRPQAEAASRQAEAQLAQATRERQRRADLFARQLVAREVVEQAQQAETIAQAGAERARLAAQSAASGGSEEVQLRERLAAAHALLARTIIRSSTGGVVLTRNVEPGDLVQPGRVLLEIARTGDTEIEVLVDEKNLAVLAVGQQAQCIADAYPGQVFAATVNYIAPAIDAQRGTVTLRLKVDPLPTFLRQDMTVSVNVETGRRAQALAVPNDALLNDADGRTAVLVSRAGRLHRVPVRLGLAGLSMTEIVDGPAAGELVLAAAASVTVREGARVRVAEEGLPATSASADTDAASRRELPAKFD